jgi:hypothetical protein
MTFLTNIWVRMDNKGLRFGYERAPISQRAWKTLLEMTEGYSACGFDDPRQINPIEGEWTEDMLWVKEQIEEWDMDPAYIWEFFHAEIPLVWAIKNGIVSKEQVNEGNDYHTRLVMAGELPEPVIEITNASLKEIEAL